MKSDPVLMWLVGLILVFTVLLFISAEWLANDGQTFQVVSSLLTGFSGAFLARVTPPKHKDDGAPPQPPEIPKP